MGPMFSGKTTTLLSHERRYQIAGKQCILVKWDKDTRYSKEDLIITHDGARNTGKTPVYSVATLSQLPDLSQVDVIMIDEGQFYPDLGEFCRQWHTKKTIVISCLSGDYRQIPFGSIVDVLGLADNIIHVKAICTKCGYDAPYTIRTGESTEQTLVGAEELYQPRCGSCLHMK